MELKIDLPKSENWSNESNYAENLRMGTGGCRPVGVPRVAVADGGLRCEALGRGLLTVGDDHHCLALDGRDIGSLGAPFAAVLPDGDDAIVFTDDGPEWIVDGRLQGSMPSVAVTMEAQAVGEVSQQVLLPALKGNYPRSEGELAAVDVSSVFLAVREVAELLQAKAPGVQPRLMSWRMVDSAGRTVAVGEPRLVGLGVQGSETLQFQAKHSASTMTIEGSAVMKMQTWRLKVTVGASASEFWRRRVARLEILSLPLQDIFIGVGGRFLTVNSEMSQLNVTPQTALSAAESEARSRFGAQARVVAVVPNPLAGYSGAPELNPQGALAGESSVENFVPAFARRFGSMVVYGLKSEPGILLTALSSNPLQIVGRERVCQGAIVEVTSPVGSGGGWNYGRHHLLVFAPDGIYGVSIDRSLGVITSTLLHGFGVSRRDAVAVTPSAIYVATDRATLLRLQGSRAAEVDAPVEAVALTYVLPRGELWLLAADGTAATIDRAGRCTRRTDIRPTSFPVAAYALDTSNAVRSLADEGREAVNVAWCRQTDAPLGGFGRCRWRLESAAATNLTLTLLADSGGVPQRLTQLTVNGAVNAPIVSQFVAPRRLRLTARLAGTLAADSRLLSVSL